MNMLKQFTLILFSISFINIINAQEAFQPGWYIINPGASYSVLQEGGGDFEWNDEEFRWVAPDIMALTMNVSEAVLVFSFSKDKYYCFDPNGRIVVFQGINSLSKAPASATGVVYLNVDITLPGGEDVLTSGSYYWCASEDDENFILQLEGGKTTKIKKGITINGEEKVLHHTGAIKQQAKNTNFKYVGN